MFVQIKTGTQGNNEAYWILIILFFVIPPQILFLKTILIPITYLNCLLFIISVSHTRPSPSPSILLLFVRFIYLIKTTQSLTYFHSLWVLLYGGLYILLKELKYHDYRCWAYNRDKVNCNVFGPLILYEIIRCHVQFLHVGMTNVLIMLWEVWTPCQLMDFPVSPAYLPKSCISYVPVAVITMP